MKPFKTALLTLAAILVSLSLLSGCNKGTPPPKANPNAIRHPKNDD